MQITIDLGSEYTDGNLQEAIIAAAGARALGLLESQEQLIRNLDSNLRKAYEEAIKDKLPALIEDALEQGVQQTNDWGEPKGPPVPLKKLIHDIATAELRKPVDRHSSRSQTVLQHVLHQAVERELTDELREAVNNAKAEVIAAVKDKAAEELSERIRRASL